MSTAEDLIRRHRLSVSDYHCMGDAGIFAMDAQVELIEGELVDMTPIGSEHASIVRRLTGVFYAAVKKQAIVSVQNPIILLADSEPEPDVALLRFREDSYSAAHPHAEDVLLIVEVADTSLRYDREIKVPLYARYAIPEVWLIDINNKCLHMFTEPDGSDYSTELKVASLTSVTPQALPDMQLDLSRLF